MTEVIDDFGYDEYARGRVIAIPAYDPVTDTPGALPEPAKPATGCPDNNPKTAFGLAKCPMHLCPPALTAGAAEAFANGADKYGAYNWREKKISASVYYAAALRHLKDWWDRVDENDCAPDSGVHHVKHSAACHGMILDVMDSPMFNDDRPVKVKR